MNFMDYWDAFLRLSTPVSLTEKPTMDALNRARGNFKHYGTAPSATNIEGFRANTVRFLTDNTQIVFGFAFTDISLVELVTYTRTKTSLTEAEILMKSGSFKESLEKSALAYAQLVTDYENNKRDRFGRTPFFFGDMRFVRDIHLPSVSRSGLPDIRIPESRFDRELNIFIDKTKDAVESINDALKTLALGIDFRMFLKFRLITPNVHPAGGGTFAAPYWPEVRTQTREEADFAVNFVVESAINLQENDW